MTVQNILNKSSQILKKTSTTPLLDAEVFLCEAIKKNKEFILANPDFELSENPPAGGEKKFWEMVERRKKYEPAAYIVNKKEFFGLDCVLCSSTCPSKLQRRRKGEEGYDHKVLIPRPETEMMVEMAVGIIKGISLPPLIPPSGRGGEINIVDVGTGSGCIIAAIANFPSFGRRGEGWFFIENKINFFALDYSANSLEIAKKNFENLNLPIKVLQGDLLEPYLQHRRDPSPNLSYGQIFGVGMTKKITESNAEKKEAHIILANLPYLNADEYKNCPQEVKKYEPKTALYGGKDGLKYIKKLIAQIEKSGLENYYLILEISPSQAEYLRNLGFEIKRDLFEVERFATYISPPNGGGG